jgi:pentatricopeptide repeat protein
MMLDEGGRPNGVTFLSLLSACSHSGLVNEVQEFFDCMTRTFGITPELGHHTCMVDVLGRSGNLDDALQVISDMNVKPDGRIWGALLASCRTYSNSKLASYVAQKLMKLEPGNVGYHVVFSNTQASSDQWDEVESIRSSMVEMDLQKLPAWTCVAETGCEIEVSIDGPCSQCTVLWSRSPRDRRCQWGLFVAGRVQLLARGSNRSDWMGCEYLALLAVKFSGGISFHCFVLCNLYLCHDFTCVD